MRERDWYDRAIETIKRIKAFKHTSPLAMYCSPENYIEVLEDFTKLLYGLNQIPVETLSKFEELNFHFGKFKSDLIEYCEMLLKDSESPPKEKGEKE